MKHKLWEAFRGMAKSHNAKQTYILYTYLHFIINNDLDPVLKKKKFGGGVLLILILKPVLPIEGNYDVTPHYLSNCIFRFICIAFHI